MIEVSVIVGFYKRERYVSRTLQSLLNQTEDKIEIIAFDDCSPDNSFREIKKFQHENLIYYQHEQNIGFTKGLINAINNVSNGKYIAIHGSGDVAELTRIEKQKKVLDENKSIGVVGCYYDNIVENENILRPRRLSVDDVTLESLRKANVFSHGEVMFRRDVYNQAGGYRSEFRFCQDYDLWLRMIKLSKFHTVKEKLYNRYIQFDGVSYDPEKFILQARYYLLAQRLSMISEVEQVNVLSTLRKDGPKALVTQDDPELQKRILHACLRLIAWGNETQAKTLAEELISSIYKKLVSTTAYFASSSMMKLPKKVVYKMLKIQKKYE